MTLPLLLGALILGGGLLGIYGRALHSPFIFDDASAIVDNSSVRQLWPPVGSAEAPSPLNPPRVSPVNGRPLEELGQGELREIFGTPEEVVLEVLRGEETLELRVTPEKVGG